VLSVTTYGHAHCFQTTLFDYCLTAKGAPMFEGLLQPLHLLLIVGIALLCFGPRKFADFGKGLGDGIRNIKSDATSGRAGNEDKNRDKCGGGPMGFSGMLFLMLLGLIIFGPKKLPQVGKQIGRVLAELKSFTRAFKSQLVIEKEGASKQEKIALASLPPSKSPTETDQRVPETYAFGSERGRVEASHG